MKRIRRGARVTVAALVVFAACSPTPEAAAPPLSVDMDAEDDDDDPAREFVFTTIDGKVVSADSYRGRMTLIAFVTTYDMASHAQARFVNSILFKHKPRINALMLALEPPANRPLVEEFAAGLELRCDVAMADADTIAGRGAFPGLHHVPSIVLLDRDGREVWRSLGLVEEAALEEAIVDHE